MNGLRTPLPSSNEQGLGSLFVVQGLTARCTSTPGLHEGKPQTAVGSGDGHV